MPDGTIDILMITYNRPEYTRLSLTRLLESCDESMRVWVWHNGTHDATLSVVRSLVDHPRLFAFHHSQENRRLREPTNWMWARARGEFLSKVDDDCLVPPGWAQTLREAHRDVKEFGVISCWHLAEQDIVPELVSWKIRDFANGRRLMVNCWTGGSGYLMKRRCVEECGVIPEEKSFTDYCVGLALRGWVNGWPYPLICLDHMDDPRSPHTRYRTEEDFQRDRSLSARTFSAKTLEEFRELHHIEAIRLQRASINPRSYVGWRPKVRRFWNRMKRVGAWAGMSGKRMANEAVAAR